MSKVKRILFVCRANVGRSQMAEGFYANLHSSAVSGSAGVEDHRLKYQGKPTDNIIRLMAEKDIDIQAHTVKQIHESQLADYDAVVVFCEPEICPVFLRKSSIPVIYREVTDPDQVTYEVMQHIRDQIEQIVLQVDAELNA